MTSQEIRPAPKLGRAERLCAVKGIEPPMPEGDGFTGRSDYQQSAHWQNGGEVTSLRPGLEFVSMCVCLVP